MALKIVEQEVIYPNMSFSSLLSSVRTIVVKCENCISCGLFGDDYQLRSVSNYCLEMLSFSHSVHIEALMKFGFAPESSILRINCFLIKVTPYPEDSNLKHLIKNE